MTLAPARPHRRWLTALPLAVALAAVGVALALPSPSSRPVAGAAPAGPTRLVDVWPGATTATVPAEVAGGLSFEPLNVIDADRMLGLATNPDLTTAQLVVRAKDGSLKVLHTLSGVDRPTVAATAIAGGRVYWIETGDGDAGTRETTVWAAQVAGGPAVRVARDTSDVLYYDSEYDLQVQGGRVWWAAAGATPGEFGPTGELRSVPVGGGAETVRPLDRLYALTAWPWLTTSGASQAGDVLLYNLDTGQTRTVTAAANEILTCTPTWCRVTTLVNQGQSLRFEDEHPDGQARRKIGDTALTPLNTDVALLGRFEVVASLNTAASSTQQLWLHDLGNDRTVLLDQTASASLGSRGGYLWWSTGDNETMSWHLLDLHTLT